MAIVTARKTAETHYRLWAPIARDFLAGRRSGRYLSGEWGALLAACGAVCWDGAGEDGAEQLHLAHQLDALSLQTRPPDHVLIVDRVSSRREIEDMLAFDRRGPDRYPFEVQWCRPQTSPAELAHDPGCACPDVRLHSDPSLDLFAQTPRTRSIPFGNADKNTAIALCQTEHLVMLDDCCLPGFGLVELAEQICTAGNIGMIQHQKLYLPAGERVGLEVAEANTGPESPRRVYGVWAMPIEYALAINGYNVELDGQHADWDLEFGRRLEMYARLRQRELVFHPRLACYEIEHDTPWDRGVPVKWEIRGFCAPGPNLAAIAARAKEQRAEAEVEDNEQADEQ